jgi:integrase
MRDILRDGPNGLRNEALFVLGINTPFRAGDLLALKVGDVLSEGKLKSTLVQKEKKPRKNLLFSLKSSVSKTLLGYLRSRGSLKLMDPDEPLFPSFNDPTRPISRQRVYQIFQNCAVKIGLRNFSALSMRKTFLYHLFKETGDIEKVQKYLFHDSPFPTINYVGLEQSDIDEAGIDLSLYQE